MGDKEEESNENVTTQVIGLANGILSEENIKSSIRTSPDKMFATRGDMLLLQASINKQLVSQNELMKNELHSIKAILSPLSQSLEDVNKHIATTNDQLIKLWEAKILTDEELAKVKDGYNTLDKKFKKHSNDIGDLKKEVQLLKEIKNCSCKEELGNLKNQVVTMGHHQTITDKIKDVEVRCDRIEGETMFNIKEDIISLSNKNSEFKSIQGNQIKLEAEVLHLKNKINNIPAPVSQSTSSTTPKATIKKKEVNYDNVKIESEIILLVDSNGAKVDPERLSREAKCQKIFTPTWSHVKDLIKKLKKSQSNFQNVKQIWTHIGTNDTDSNEPLEIIINIEETLGEVKKLFPEAIIHVSKIIPRKSNDFVECISRVNDFIDTLCRKNRFNKVNYRISEKMLDDEKHVNKKGFSVLLGTLKYVLFGIVPIIYDSKPRRGGRFNRR